MKDGAALHSSFLENKLNYGLCTIVTNFVVLTPNNLNLGAYIINGKITGFRFLQSSSHGVTK